MKLVVFICLSSFYFSFPVEEVRINGNLDISPGEEEPRTEQRTFGLIRSVIFGL
jgi:hypothetical protein